MRHVTLLLAAIAIALFAAAPAAADWKPEDGHKMHWPQLPDLLNGLDVLATFPHPAWQPGADQMPFGKVLADDWRCSQSGPVLDVHIWWRDELPISPDGNQDPGLVAFKLSIHKDIPDPDGPNEPGYSMPGELLREWIVDPLDPASPVKMKVVPIAENLNEQFWDPNGLLPMTPDTRVWQYNFFFTDQADPFIQREGEIYWLDVQAMPLGQNLAAWGWKTTTPDLHFNDDAVFGDNEPEPGSPVPAGGWTDLHYPDGHIYEGMTVDMAFVITPEPGTIAMLLSAGAVGLLLVWRRRRK
jgi:hypothetical protein